MAELTIEKVFEIIKDERAFQRRRWGIVNEEGIEREPAREVGDFIVFMEKYLQDARTQYTEKPSDTPALEELRKVIALGVQCLQLHGCPARVINIPVVNAYTGILV